MPSDPWRDEVEARIATAGLTIAAVLTIVLIVAQALR
jgi:hypothetical protein